MPFEEREYEWVQKPFIEKLEELGYEYYDPKDLEKERESLRSVLLIPRLRDAIKRLNEWLPEKHLDAVLGEVIRTIENPAQPSLVACNEVVHWALVKGVNVQLDLGEGLRFYTIKLIDFDNPENNNFLVTDSLPKRSSFKVQGYERSVEPDIIIFVNGIPLVVVEAKDPTIVGKDPLEEAQRQLERYQKDAPQLFYPNLFVVATVGEQCTYAPVNGEFILWRDEEKAQELGVKSSTSQDVFISCVLTKENLLDFLKSFVAFADEVRGKVKKIARPPQWRAVNKAVKSAWEVRNKRKDGKGGTIWHWQGSGKTLTMLWLALKLRREFQNPCIIMLTDRKELDKQMADNFRRHGYPSPIHIERITQLGKELRQPIGKTLIVTLQKLGNKLLQETTETEHLSEEENIFVIADEAHRGQYAVLAARMRSLLPKATFFAFTGTPLEREDRNTPQVFGSYVDRYTIMDALRDKVTVPILYNPRLPELHLSSKVNIDELLAAYFRDLAEDEEQILREKIKNLKLKDTQVAQIEDRMQKVAEDIVEHFLREVEPKGFKAMVVAHRRKMAVEYKRLVDEALQKRGRSDIKTDVVITVQQNEVWARKYQRTPEEEQQLINQFRDPNNPLKILFVSDKLLTGFDAPILQVMYFDKRLREHTLLQAIARVNRPFKLKRTIDGKELEVEKDYGLIVDYFGIARELEEALAKYEKRDVEGIYEKPEGLFERIKQVWEEIRQIFGNIDLMKAEWEKEDIEQCVDVLKEEEKRKEFALLVREFGRLLNQLLPDPKALPYKDIFKRLVQIRQNALLRYIDPRLRQKDYLPKLMDLLNNAINVIGITVLEPVEVTSKEFLNQLEFERKDTGKAEMLINALNAYISEHIHEDPQFYQSLQEQLEAIIKEFQERKREAKEFVAELMKLRKQILQQEMEAEKLGLTKKQLPFFHFLKAQGIEQEKAKKVVLALEQAIREVWQKDWWLMEGVRRKMKVAIYKVLKEHGIEREKAENWQNELLNLAEQHYRRWD